MPVFAATAEFATSLSTEALPATPAALPAIDLSELAARRASRFDCFADGASFVFFEDDDDDDDGEAPERRAADFSVEARAGAMTVAGDLDPRADDVIDGRCELDDDADTGLEVDEDAKTDANNGLPSPARPANTHCQAIIGMLNTVCYTS